MSIRMHKTRFSSVALSFLFLMYFISVADCRKVNATHKIHKIKKVYTPEAIPDFPLDFGTVFTEASDVFRNVLGKMLSKKRIVGINKSDWYW